MGTEVEYKRTFKRIGDARYYGFRSFACPDAEAMGFAASLYNQPWPDAIPSGGTCLCDQPEIQWHPNGLKGVCLIHAVYNTPGSRHIPVGYARITVDMEPIDKRVVSYKDKNGNTVVMEGPDNAFAGVHWIHQNSPWITSGRMSIIVQTAFYWGDMPDIANTFASLQGTTNLNALPNICNMPAKSLMFIGARESKSADRNLCQLNITLLASEWDTAGNFVPWDKKVISRAGAWVVATEPAITVAGINASDMKKNADGKVYLPGKVWSVYDQNGLPVPSSSTFTNTLMDASQNTLLMDRTLDIRAADWSVLKTLQKWSNL